jgi:hypothetical protein
VRAADEGWEKDREWVALKKCAKHSMVRVVEKPVDDPAFDGVVFEDENGNLIADEPEASDPVEEVAADKAVPVEEILAAAEPEPEEKKAMAARPAKKGRKPAVSTDVVPEETELAPTPETVDADAAVDIEDEELLVKKINLMSARKIYNKFVRNSKFLAQKAKPKLFMKQIYKVLTN